MNADLFFRASHSKINGYTRVKHQGIISNMSEELINTLNKKDALDAFVGISEVSLDSFMESGLLKDVPILGTLVQLTKFGLSISDYIFIKKLQQFCSEFNEISEEERNQFFIEINAKPRLQKRVNDNLLMLVNASDDIEKPKFIGKIFGAYLKSLIIYDQFMKFSTSVNGMNVSQLSKLRNLNGRKVPNDTGNIMASFGLVIISIPTTAGSSSPEYFLNEDGIEFVSILFENNISSEAWS